MNRARTLLSVVLAAFAVLPGAGRADVSDELVVPLTGTEPDGASRPPDLEALAGWLGDADVVGLGESLHGVHEFRRLAHRIFAHLVERRGFDVFALEIDQAHAFGLNEFVEGRRDDLDALLADRWWAATFYDQALRELLVWMRRYNLTAERPIHFAGFDIKQPSLAAAEVVDGLARLDPAAATRARDLYATVLGLGGFGVYPNVYGYSASLSVPLPPRTGSKTLRVRLRGRGREVSHGWIGLALEDPSENSASPGETVYLTADKLGDAWATLDLEARLSDRIDEIRLVVFHRGNGTVWFDGLELTLDGRPVELKEGLDGFRAEPLEMPRIQIMDYGASFDDRVSFAGGRSLRVDCDPAVDEALRAAREANALFRAKLATGQDLVPDGRKARLRQMSRLVLQATEWRTLVETNRDAFLAENVAWLQQQAFPGSRVLALASSSHTNRRARGRGMGLLLAEAYGDRYRTVTMTALAGNYRDFGDSRALAPDAERTLFSFEAGDARPLARRLASLGAGDLMVHLRRAAESAAIRQRLDPLELPVREVADVAILVRRVHASLPP